MSSARRAAAKTRNIATTIRVLERIGIEPLKLGEIRISGRSVAHELPMGKWQNAAGLRLIAVRERTYREHSASRKGRLRPRRKAGCGPAPEPARMTHRERQCWSRPSPREKSRRSK